MVEDKVISMTQWDKLKELVLALSDEFYVIEDRANGGIETVVDAGREILALTYENRVYGPLLNTA